MKFAQHVIFKTTDIEAVRKVSDEYDRNSAAGGPSGLLLQDRDNPGQYVFHGVFDSYEEAMKNNDRPETQQMAKQMGELVTNLTYRNFDVIEEM
jgi:quinol monooxygenase YgiN